MHRSYLPLVPLLIVLACIPNYTLRIHHYLYALAAIPVLSLPNRVSLFGQAFMLGLFLDGVGRWGWASIIEQTTSVSAPGGAPNTGSMRLEYQSPSTHWLLRSYFFSEFSFLASHA